VSVLLDVVSAVCFVAAGLLAVTAGLGLLRFPDVLSRMHAATKPQVGGVVLVCLGAALQLAFSPVVWTLLLVALFQLMTAPLSAHLVGRIAHRRGHVRRDLLVVDELGPAGSAEEEASDEPADSAQDS